MRKQLMAVGVAALVAVGAAAPVTAPAASAMPMPSKVTFKAMCSMKNGTSSTYVIVTRYHDVPWKDRILIQAADSWKLTIWSITVDGKAANIQWLRTPQSRWPGDKRKTTNKGSNTVNKSSSRVRVHIKDHRAGQKVRDKYCDWKDA